MEINIKYDKISFIFYYGNLSMNSKTILSYILYLLFPFILHASSLTDSSKTKMTQDIDLIKSILEVKYAPAEWKKSYTGWDLDREVQDVKNRVLQTPHLTTSDYQKILLNFFNSMQDYHVTVNFYATEMSILPFRIQGVNGRYFIAWIPNNPAHYADIDSNLHEMLSQTKIGDEVISFGGVSAEEYVQTFKRKAFGEETNGTDQMLAEQYLTLRMASKGYDVEQGTIPITINHQSTGDIRTYSPEWIYVPEQIKNHFPETTAYQFYAIPSFLKKKTVLFDKMMMTPIQEHLEKARKEIKKNLGLKNNEDSDFLVIGQYKSFVPQLGKVIWNHTESHYYAYIFTTAKNKKIGYVRIPTFVIDSDEYLDFEKLIKRFQKETDALIIDQVNNPGGSVVYLFSLLSMMSNEPLALPPERMTITQEDVSEALSVLENPEDALEQLVEGIAGFSITLEEIPKVAAYFQSIIDEWNAGRSFTNPIYYYGISEIKPNPKAHYSKPILVLVNYLDFSCADFFPAILQDNNRAKIFGSKTAGAGGFVLRHEYPNLFGIKEFSYTGSIAYRTNNKPIENLGVTPDYPYEIRVEDLTNGYKSYAQAILNALDDMLK